MYLLRLKTFLKSLLFHVQAGLPKSSKAQIQERYSICISCEKYNKERSECMVCGCAISNKKRFLNKLAWADQECPIGKWQKLV
jgi:hypothetical protein